MIVFYKKFTANKDIRILNKYHSFKLIKQLCNDKFIFEYVLLLFLLDEVARVVIDKFVR